MATLTLERKGSYGTVNIGWLKGYYAPEEPQGYAVGALTPETGTIALAQGDSAHNFSVKVTINPNAARG